MGDQVSAMLPANRQEAIKLMLDQGGFDSLPPEQRAAIERNWKYTLPPTPPPQKPNGYPGVYISEEETEEDPDLTEDQKWVKAEILGLAKDIRGSQDPDRVGHLEVLVLEFNRKSEIPFTDDQVREILAQDEAERLRKLEREIVITGHNLGYLTKRAIRALENWNQPPRLFRRAGGIVRITLDEAGRPIIDRADEFTVRWALAEAADWFQQSKYNPGPAFPPMDVVRNLMREPSLSLPPLKGTIEIPTLRADGSIILAPGYDEQTGLYYAPDPDLVIPEVPDRPTRGEVKRAVELLLEIFCDFPFIDGASRANTIATLITPILRPMIRGPIPLALFDKPTAGTGASLLAEMVSLIVTGRDAAMFTAPVREEEWDKKIASVLLDGSSVAVIDNVNTILKSGSFSSVLTCTTYGGRLLGKTEKLELIHRTVWMATGINIQLGGDMPRRCYLVRMDPECPRPEKREGFKHPELKDWILTNRGKVIAAILTICRAWTRAGAPLPPSSVPIMGSFEHWRSAVGGILQHCGIKEFLGNLDELYEESDTEGPEWERFFEKWYELWGEKGITVAFIVDSLRNERDAPIDQQLASFLPDSIAEVWSLPGKFSHKLGYELAHHNGRIFPNGLRLKKGPTSHKVATWIVRRKIS
jgi:hypothetical protein